MRTEPTEKKDGPEAVREKHEELKLIAESDLPASWIAEELLEDINESSSTENRSG